MGGPVLLTVGGQAKEPATVTIQQPQRWFSNQPCSGSAEEQTAFVENRRMMPAKVHGAGMS